MKKLTEKHCKPCEGDVKPFTAKKARTLRSALHRDWQLDATATELRRNFQFKDFYRTMSFVNALAHVANLEDHHPDLAVGYNYCHVRLSTHSIKGLSENDFICAAKVDALLEP